VNEESESVDDEKDWGNPPSPYTAENRKKALRAQLIIGIFAFVGILLPGLLFWLTK
tara:strand:+ start:1667 stop:1834 length:168 start_codon:yes stop_codon:yes gene_type:complete